MFMVRLPSDCPSTITPGRLIDVPLGDDNAPLELKVKVVPTLVHSGVVPVALVLVW